MTYAIKSTSGLKLSPRSKVRLMPDEMIELENHVLNDNGSLATIRLNTKIHPDTIKLGIERGWFEAAAAVKLRDYLKKIKDITI